MQELRGFENLMVDITVHRDRFHTLARAIVDYNLSLVDMWVRTTVDEVFIGDSWGAQDRTLISPLSWCEFFKPYYTERCLVKIGRAPPGSDSSSIN